ncbi:GGDEF domain-containing protein [Spirochaeta thermophila]|uniref:diguanylate cyclase n=1 Tax=Winmispira thermophila (strain ATCC 49972 / DSM 6192 / RI 19.B1) TaxID=665571 RepID=E0RQM2_WINT6|nr:GGDEF domain-containing protein [Spirochaeta thermophila]ADN01526.1 hypothetical protein STHERM_c05610 [Spirochaeta thermophila DSM 6192]
MPMEGTNREAPGGNEDYLKYYDLLKRIGVLDELQHYRNEISNLEEIISQAVELLSKSSIEEVLEVVVQGLMDKFIPSYLTLILQEAGVEGKILVKCYERLREIPPPFEITSLDGYREFFERHPSSISFSLFEYKVPSPGLVEPLRAVEAEILVPVIGMGGVYGLIVFGKKVLGEDYTPQELAYIGRLVEFVSISLQNNIHYRSSIMDFKTGIYNASFFMRRLEEELYRVKRYGGHLGLIILDVDHFKLFNDRYGHLAGDEVLISIARNIKQNLRKGDVAARYGGEEFVVLLPGANRNAAYIVAERVRHSIELMKVYFEDKILHVTVSVGVTSCTRYRLLDPRKLIEEADQALYLSKERGRNRTTVYRKGLLSLAEEYREALLEQVRT